jgi:hypothetical protein
MQRPIISFSQVVSLRTLPAGSDHTTFVFDTRVCCWGSVHIIKNYCLRNLELPKTYLLVML